MCSFMCSIHEVMENVAWVLVFEKSWNLSPDIQIKPYERLYK